MSCFQYTPYGDSPIQHIASAYPTWGSSDTDSNTAQSAGSVSSSENELGYISSSSSGNDSPLATPTNRRRQAFRAHEGTETVAQEPKEAVEEVIVPNVQKLPPLIRSFRSRPGDAKEKFLEKQVENGVPLAEMEAELFLRSPEYIFKHDRLSAATSFSPEVFDEDAKALIEWLRPQLEKSDDRLVRHLVDLMLPYVKTLWRKLEVSNYLISFLYFLGKEAATLPLQLALLPYLKEMMNHPHGNTTARGLLLHGHPFLVPMVRSLICEPSTLKLLDEREKFGFYVLRWYHQSNRVWMEANCPLLAARISAMDRKAQSTNYTRRN